MANKKNKTDPKMQEWIDARKRHHLSHEQVQMARELGMNPKKLGGMDNHRQEPWKTPLPEFIGDLYFKRFGKERPDVVLSIEEKVKRDHQVKLRKREQKLERRRIGAGAPENPQAAPLHLSGAESGSD